MVLLGLELLGIGILIATLKHLLCQPKSNNTDGEYNIIPNNIIPNDNTPPRYECITPPPEYYS